MSANTNTRVPTPSNPSSLKPRYEIRQLQPEHLPWATAIVAHSNLFYSPVWPVIYPKDINSRLHQLFEALKYLCRHQINSGISFGVFDTEYAFKQEASKPTGGKLYWDRSEKGVQEEKGLAAEGQRLLEQMDFPLVSVALSFDGINPLDHDKMTPAFECLPLFGKMYEILEDNDARDSTSWQPSGPNQVVFRNATSTRHDYEGEGIMGGLARWLMREMDAKGYRGIQIECVHDAVTHVWSNPREPYKGGVVSEFHTTTWRDEAGKLAYAPALQRFTKCYVELKPKV